MIPNANNINNFNNQIKIQLTTDNKCLIQALSESPIKSQNTIQKDDFSINDDMSLSKSNSSCNNINNNNSQSGSKPIILNSNKKNSNNDFDSNSNLLISFSNISEVTKINNNDCSLTRINSNKNNSILMNKDKDFIKNSGSNINININNNIIGDKNMTINNLANYEGNSFISNNNFLINKENIAINSVKTPMRNVNQNKNTVNKNKTSNKKTKINKKLLNAFNKNDLSENSCGIINLNVNGDEKSENFDKVNFVFSDKKSGENNSFELNIKNVEKNEKSEQNKNLFNKNNKCKCFKNCTVQKNEDINIIQANPKIEKTIESNKSDLKNNQEKIVPNHCANFSFNGIIKNNQAKELDINSYHNSNLENKQKFSNLNLFQNQIDTYPINNTNTLDINDDYVSPTFNLNLNYNSLDKNNINTIESSKEKEKEISPEIFGSNKNISNNIGIKNYNNSINNNKDNCNNINIKKKKEKSKKEDV